MKLVALTFAALIPFSASAYQLSSNTISIHQAKAPMMQCANALVSASLYSLPNEKEAEMIIENVSATYVSRQVVQPMFSTEGEQVFVSENAALVVSEKGEKLEGVLNIDQNQPGAAQVLDCQVYYETLPIPVHTALE